MNFKPGRLARLGQPAEVAFLAVCLATRLAVGLSYSQIVPPWESYDEPGHFEYARYIAKYGRLPQSGDPEADAIWSKFQPPLYYLLLAPALRGFDLGERFQAPILNIFLANGNAGVNYAATPDRPTGLEQQTLWALRVGRAIGGLLSAVSLVFVYLTARRLWPREQLLAQTATLVYAFWPQAIFIGNMMTNDLLVSSLAAPILFLIVVDLQDGLRRRTLLLLSALLAAAVLTKLNGLALAPAALVTLLAPAGSRRPLQRPVVLAVLAGLLVAALAMLNSMEFVTSHVLQLGTLQRYVNNVRAVSLDQVFASPGVVAYGLWTFFASYGWGNLETFPWLYWLWLAGVGAAGLGLVWPGRPAATPATQLAGRISLVLAITLGGVLGLSAVLSIAQDDRNLVVGRYWLPALPSLVLLLVAGWHRLAPGPARPWVLKAGALVMVLASWMAPFAIIAPAYAKPRPITAAEANQIDRSRAADFGDAIRLIGLRPPGPVVAGQKIALTLCWEARRPVAANYPMLLELVGPDGQGYGRLNTYPGDGNYPTQLWSVGVPFCDRYQLPSGKDFPAPAVGAVRVAVEQGLFQPGLPARALDGRPLGQDIRLPIIVRSPEKPPAPAVTTNYRFGDKLSLRGYTLAPLPEGHGLRMSLLWETSAPLAEDYKVFVHLRDTPRTAYAQSDQAPRGDTYPTSAWAAGELVLDEHNLTWPAGATPPPLTLYVGVYRAADGVRLPIVDGQGEAVPNGELLLPLSGEAPSHSKTQAAPLE
jgi:hypothetical protein